MPFTRYIVHSSKSNLYSLSYDLFILSLQYIPAAWVHSRPASGRLFCLSTSLFGSAVAVPQTSSSPSLLLTSSGSESRTSSSHGPPLTSRGAELTTRALFVDWEEGCGLDSSILELQGHGYSTGSEDLLILLRTIEKVSSQIFYNYCMVWSTSNWAGCYWRRVLLFLPSVSVPHVRFHLLWSLKSEQCLMKCHLCDSCCPLGDWSLLCYSVFIYACKHVLHSLSGYYGNHAYN